MPLFFVVLSMVCTLGICRLIDRENMPAHVAAVAFMALCVLFWVVFPAM